MGNVVSIRARESRLSKIESATEAAGQRFFMLWHPARQSSIEAMAKAVAAGKCGANDPAIALAWAGTALCPVSRWTMSTGLSEVESGILFEAAVAEYEASAAAGHCPTLDTDMRAPMDPVLTNLSDRELMAQIIEGFIARPQPRNAGK